MSYDPDFQITEEIVEEIKKNKDDILGNFANDTSGIPRFGKKANKLSDDARRALAMSTRDHLTDLVKKKIPTDVQASEILRFISDQQTGLIKFNKNKFKEVKEKFKDFAQLFSDKILRSFIICRKYFDIEKFAKYLKYIKLLNQELVNILVYSSAGNEYVSAQNFEDYVNAKLQTFPETSRILRDNDDERNLYISFIVEKIFATLDKLNRNRLLASDIIASPDFQSFLELDKPQSPLSFNAYRKYFSDFNKLSNSDGLIPPSNFKYACDKKFSQPFLTRLFEYSITYEGCLDFAGFLHIANTIDRPDEFSQMYFHIIDVDGDGIIGPSDVLFFYQGETEEVGRCGVSFDTILQEVLDQMSSHQVGITYDEFEASGNIQWLVTILGEIDEFKDYVMVG